MPEDTKTDSSLDDITVLLEQINARVESFVSRSDRVEEDIAQILLVQDLMLKSINELSSSVLRLRESTLRIKNKLG